MKPARRRLTKKGRSRKYYRPLIECLEDRTLPSTVFGAVWNDLVADGIRAAGEPPIAAVSVVLEQNGVQVAEAVTNGSGSYRFDSLAPGFYALAVAAPVGAALTFPSGGNYSFQLADGETLSDMDFGLQLAAGAPANTDVTSDPAVQQMPSVAVNPLDSSHVVTAYMDYSANADHGAGYAGIGISVSHDGGETWESNSIPLPGNFDQAAGHPIAQFDAQGHLFVSFMAATFLGRDANGNALKPGVVYDTGNETVSYLGKSVSRRAFGMQANNGVFVARWDEVNLNWNVNPVTSQRYDLTFTSSIAAVAANTTATITPAQMPANLFLNKTLIIDEGLPTMERVRVTALTATTFTALFTKAHAAGFSISVPVYFDAIPDMAIDTNPASPHYGNLYATWTRFYPAGQFPGRAFVGVAPIVGGSEIMFAVSTDGGQTWTTRLQTVLGRTVSAVSDPLTGGGLLASPPFNPNTLGTGGSTATATEGAGTNTLSRVAVGPDGGVYVTQFAGNRFPVFYSTDAGASFRIPVPDTTNPNSAGYPFGIDSDQYTAIYPVGASGAAFVPSGTLFNNAFRTQAVRAITADPARPGHVYAVEAVQILNTAGTVIDAGEITFARSTDFGVTWQRIFTVGSNTGNLNELPADKQFRYRSALNDDNATRFIGFDATLQDEVISGQALPQLSVDAQGNIAVIWYDTRRDAANRRLDVYGAVSTDGGLSFSPNSRFSEANFDAGAGAFSDARNASNAYLGDRIGLALANGTAYAAWTGTTSGNQDIVFTRVTLTPAPAPFGDRFESNDAVATAVDLGTVTAQRVVPDLSLGGNDSDWFSVVAGASGQLLVGASAPFAGGTIQLQLWDEAGTTQLAVGTPTLANGQIVGQQLQFPSVAGTRYLVHIHGSGVPAYALTLQSLTGDLGTRVDGSVGGTISSGGQALYRLAAAVTGTLELTLTSGANVQGDLNLQVLSANGETVLASSVPPGTPGAGEVEHISLPVNAGQAVLLQVAGATTTSVDVNGTVVTLNRGVPGAAIRLPLPANKAVSLQSPGNLNPVRVRITGLTGTLASVGTQDVVINPGATVSLVLASNATSFNIQSLDAVGSGSFNLSFTNLDAFQASDQTSKDYSTGGTAAGIATGDLNGDGRSDLVLTSTQSGDQVSVLLANPDGTFQAPRHYAVGAGQAAISNREPVLADFTSDGILDIVVPNYFSADVSLLVGLGDGTFAPQRRFDANYKANSLASADFNGDGNPDLAVLNRTPGDATVSILLSRGDGTFVPPQNTTIPFGRGEASPVRAGDVNGDGHADVVVFSANDVIFQVLLGRGDGTFSLGDSFSTGEVLFDAQLADLNGDGHLDVVIGGGNTGSIIVSLGNGDGTFQNPQAVATAPRIGNDNIGIIGLAVADYTGDGHPDVLVTTRYRSGSDAPQAFLLPGTGAGTFGAAVKLGTSEEAGKIAVADFDGDGAMDLVITEAGGVNVLYSQPPAIVPNTTLAAARDLGTVFHYLGQKQAIVPGFTDAYYTLQVPDQVIDDVVHQVVDISALFEQVEGAGLQMDVAGALRIVSSAADSTGARMRVLALHGATLTVHISSKSGGSGTYTLDIDVLPQLVNAEALAAIPGAPPTSIVLTLQGDRLDPASAQDPANYIVRLLGPNGNTPIGDPIPLSTAATSPIIYTPGANVDVSSGRTFPTAVRQTITLLFDTPLTVGSRYRVELSSAIRTADLNDQEAGQLAHTATFGGHPLVSFSGANLVTGSATTFRAVKSSETLEDLNAGTPFLTQTQNDLSAYLDWLLRDGDNPGVTTAITNHLHGRFAGVTANPNAGPFLIIWLDPVGISSIDPNGARTTFNMQTNTVTNSIARSFIEVGGAVEVMVIAAIPGTYTLNISDVQPTARGGAILIQDGNAQTANLTDAMRGGETAFQFQFAQAVSQVTGGVLQVVTGESSASSIGNAVFDSANISATAAQTTATLLTSIIPADVAVSILATAMNLGQAGDGATSAEDTQVNEFVAWIRETDAGRAVLQTAATVLPHLPVEELVALFADAVARVHAVRLFRSIGGTNGSPASVPANDAPAVPEQRREEDEQGWVVPEDAMQPAQENVLAVHDAQPAGKLAGLFLAATLTAGAAYAASSGGKEKRRRRSDLLGCEADEID